MTISIERQIACVERELAMRKRVYHGLVGHGRMTQDDATNEIRCMQAVLDTLKSLTQPSLFATEDQPHA